MRKFLFLRWVKNVHKLCMSPRETRGYSSTDDYINHKNLLKNVYNQQLIPDFTHVSPILLPTRKNVQITPLVSHLYPQSTAPINKTDILKTFERIVYGA